MPKRKPDQDVFCFFSQSVDNILDRLQDVNPTLMDTKKLRSEIRKGMRQAQNNGVLHHMQLDVASEAVMENVLQHVTLPDY
jgi:hypothetical protein